MKTLAEIATKYGVSLGTVRNWKLDAEARSKREIVGLTDPQDGRRVLYSPEQEQAIAYGRVPINPDVVIEEGNHSMVLAAPEVANEFSLERFRADDTTALSFEDPLAIAQQFLATADMITASMQADIRQREEKLRQTQQAQQAIAAKTQELQLESRFYKEKARSIDQAQTATTQTLQQALEQLNSLGKSSS